MPGWGSGLAHAISAGLTGYDEGKQEALRRMLVMEALRRQQERDSATLDATMRSRGYVPDSERQANAVPLLSGEAIDQLASVATAGIAGPQLGHPAAATPRYGASAGGYSYDTQSPTAQMERARLGEATALERLRTEQATRAHAMLPSAGLRDALIQAGNDADDVDAVLATGDPVAIRNLLRPDPTATHAANRQYDILHPLPRRATTRTAGSESAGHREVRQGLAAVRGQLADTDRQRREMDKTAPPLVQFPGIATGTAADSAAAKRYDQQRAALAARSDSLRSVSDRLASEMTGNPTPAAGSSHAELPPLTPAQRQRAASNPDYRQFLTEKGYRF